jgi:hypothetical protein
VSEAAELQRAVASARAAVDGSAPRHGEEVERLAAAGGRAVAWLRRFEAHPASLRPPVGAPDDLREVRHDLRSAAQTVLAQLDLIAIAWRGWDAAQREVALADLEGAEEEVGGAASIFLDAARRPQLRP